MKYMGSKRYMLVNGLGEMLEDKITSYQRFIDPFSGGGFVSTYVAQKYSIPVISSDLQEYSSILVGAVIERIKPLREKQFEVLWLTKAEKHLRTSRLYKNALELENTYSGDVKKLVEESRVLCKKPSYIGPVWNAYGGHYYSPEQALSFDYLMKYAPSSGIKRKVAFASIISAASKGAAAPGHTAQPFQPTLGAMKYLYQSWQMDPFELTRLYLAEITPRHAKQKGSTMTCAAENLISGLRSSDLVFIDPPYSGVQYSRFYHVLETMARGSCGPVSGVGRYPSLTERPQSDFSNSGTSQLALSNLLEKIAGQG